MAKKKGVRVTLLVEDEALERFSREVLIDLGYSRHEIRVTNYPVGKGSAKDWVNNQYPVHVRTIRSKSYQQLALVVGTDADEATVRERADRLVNSLENEGLAARQHQERIVLWIPKWNVETWLLYFAGDARDEDQNYRKDVTKPDYRAAGAAFVREFRSCMTDDSIDTQPSLKSAYAETKRLGV